MQVEIKGNFDLEIIGLESDGTIVQWNARSGSPYNCGETPEEFGLHNIFPHELARLRRLGYAG